MTRFLVFVFFICGACFALDHDSDIFTPLRFRLGVESVALFHAPYSVDNEFAASLSADLAPFRLKGNLNKRVVGRGGATFSPGF